MGNISNGEEWLAITFNNQAKIDWTDEEFERFTKMSSSIVRQAYDRMSEQNPQQNHLWASPEKAAAEVVFLTQAMQLSAGCSIVDFGCGSGRHANALAARGYQVTGIDFSGKAIQRAKSEAITGAEFLEGDCRDITLDREFDAGICLYDVIGSFPDDESNQRILSNLAHQLKAGAPLAFSVMSYDYIEKRATNKVGNGNVREKLNGLIASDTMQASGEIFNPDHILLDTRNKVVYRREIFDNGENLRIEDIVRDRRYTFSDIHAMCHAASLTVLAVGYIRAGSFHLINQNLEEPTKEILVMARKGLV
jgi:2-polyprenyl-3-methyl-5-hydroxy-6-metoxy-1,4-benzoquinol methylase